MDDYHKYNNGFTLVELLAVIVILAIVLVIAIPGISNIISDATESSLKSSAKLVLKGIEYKMLEDESFDPTTINEANVKTELNIDSSNYERLNIKKINGVVFVTIVGKGKWNNLTVSGTKESTTIEDTVTTLVRGANAPVLTTGMTPIKWNGTSWVNTTSEDATWYNYDTTNKIWANAKTADGSMWVWIPRYIYKISTEWHSNITGTIDIQFSKGIDDNWNKSVIGNIDLGETASASNNKWTNHPAFTFGNTELTGIWVAKFEATASEGVANSYTADYSCPIAGDDVTTKTVKIVPNVASWRCTQVKNVFTVSRNMETNNVYGWGTTGNGIDTHLMKNMEWGAIAYLSKSNYGQGANEIYINNSQVYTTGCAGNTVSEALYNGCQNTYDTATGMKASTTGNIYGIYDISGGSWERTSDYLNNGHANLATYGSNILSADTKYRDVYTMGSVDDAATNYNLTINHKGDAIYETSNNGNGVDSWFGDNAYFTYTNNAWFGRGGRSNHNSVAGAFFFSRTNGGPGSSLSFRPILLVGEGL